MAQLFPKHLNTIAKLSIILGGGIAVGALVLAGVLHRAPYYTRVGIAQEQPVPFSHKHHVGGLGIDCRFCHTSVETSAFAGIPSTETCMKCHSEVWKDSPMLEPVRESFKSGKPLEWVRIHDVPDYVYFNHSIHVAKGVSCKTCHGQVDQMPLTWKENTLHMSWCLDCHRNPETFVGPKDKVFDMTWDKKNDKNAKSSAYWARHNNVGQQNKLTDCSICHR